MLYTRSLYRIIKEYGPSIASSGSKGVSNPHCHSSEGLDFSSKPEHRGGPQPSSLSHFPCEAVPELPDHSIPPSLPPSFPPSFSLFLSYIGV